jgi:uncharacterized membrane protein
LIPKGAAMFFVVGLVAAGLLGTYLLQVANQIPILVYENGPSLTIIPEKINYRSGESIHIRIINSGTVPLTFTDSSYGLKITQLDGTVIYSPISAQIVSKLDPKEEKNFVWDQTKADGSKTYQGRYKIISNASSDDGNILQRSITINILT